MMRRTMTTVAAASMLLVALFGGTALAQDGVVIDDDGFSQPNPEGYTDDQCAVAIAAYYQANYLDWFDDNLAGFEGEQLTDEVADALVRLTPVGAEPLTFADICAIYAALPEPPVVADVVIVRPERPATPPQARVPEEVMGVTIAKTGADTAILGIIGAFLMGLGVLAVRRTRTEHSAG